MNKIKKPVKKKAKKDEFENLSFSDLYAMYLFVSEDANKVFGPNNPNAKALIRSKQNQIADELYKRIYGKNPFARSKTIEGMKPEDVDLDNVADKPKTFVVVQKDDE